MSHTAFEQPRFGMPIGVRNARMELWSNPSGGSAFSSRYVTNEHGRQERIFDGIKPDMLFLALNNFDGSISISQPGEALETQLVNGKAADPPIFLRGDQGYPTVSVTLRLSADDFEANGKLRPGHLCQPWSGVPPEIRALHKSTHDYWQSCMVAHTFDVALAWQDCGGGGGLTRWLMPWCARGESTLEIAENQLAGTINLTVGWPHIFPQRSNAT